VDDPVEVTWSPEQENELFGQSGLSAHEIEGILFDRGSSLRWSGEFGLVRGYAADGRLIQVAVRLAGSTLEVIELWDLTRVTTGKKPR
jgi:hypothetical protein